VHVCTKGGDRDEKAVEQGSLPAGGSVLEGAEALGKGKPRPVVPEVKVLKELNVAGPATRTEAAFDFFIQWHLTERCNLRCRHCYQTGEKKDELSLEEIREVIEEAASLFHQWSEAYEIAFSPSFTVTGGEPFLREDLFEVLGEMRSRGFEIYLLSNGTLIDGEKARRLADLGVRGVQVSLEGPSHIHEAIRGKGSFLRAMRGVENLLKQGLRTTLNATLSRLNAEGVPDLVALAGAVGVHRLGFSRLVPWGAGEVLIGDMLEKERVAEIYRSLLSARVPGLEIVTGDPVAAQMDAHFSDEHGCTAFGGCAAGVSGLTLLSEGTVTPCRRLPVPLGNVRSDSLREIWASSPVLRDLREKDRYGGKCGRCQHWATCRGCRAIAYAYSAALGRADYLSEDPQCFIEPR
jgi:radical SAM protein with 4Fe4S-binding SPASM domain